jgi:iron complex outermembrane receptor protein
MRWKLGWLLAALVAWPGTGMATAQGTSAPVDTLLVELPEVLVRGPRPAATPEGAGVLTARLDSLPLESMPTVEQVLRALPGTHVRTNSRGEAEVTVRGSESRQVAVLLDGAPLTFTWDGRADVSVIPALAIDRVTLVRGLSSLTHGPNTLGGVVELGTAPPDVEERPGSSQLRAGVDELGGLGLAGAVAVPRDLGWGVLTARAGAGQRRSPGQTLPRGIEEPVPADRDERLNTDFRESNGFVALRVDADRGAHLSLLGLGYRAERGIAAQLGVTSARFWRYPYIARGIGIVSAGTGSHAMPWGGRADLQVSGGYDRGRTEIDAYESRDYAVVTAEEDGDDAVLTLRGTALQTLGGRGEVRAAFSYGDIRHDEILDGVSSVYRQRLWSEAAEALARVPGAGVVHEFALSAGAACDGADTPETGNKPSFEALGQWGGRLGVAARVGRGATTVHASASRRARFPSLRELYSGSLGTFEPNPGLGPEHLVALEAGVTSRTSRGALQVVGFHHRLSEAVVRIRPPGGRYQRVNQEGVRSAGVEVLASRAVGVLELSADVVGQDVRVLDPAAGLTRPENMPEWMGGLRARVPVGGGLHAAVEARFTGEQSAIDPEHDAESRLAPAGQLDVELSRDWPVHGGGWFRGVQLRAAFDNLTDAVQFDAYGLPRPGRTMRMELRAY